MFVYNKVTVSKKVYRCLLHSSQINKTLGIKIKKKYLYNTYFCIL